MARTENGTPVLATTDGQAVVSLDVVSKMAGVNLGAVSRVFAALRLLAQDTGRSSAELIDYDSMPLAAPNQERSAATERFFKEIAARNRHEPEAKFLRIVDRAATMH